MKFSQKLLLWTTIIIAITLGLSGFYFVNYVFRTSLAREVDQALDENSILRFAFQTAALNVPLKYDLLQDGSVEQIASNLETGGQGSGRLLRLSDEGKQVLYASDELTGLIGAAALMRPSKSTADMELKSLKKKFKDKKFAAGCSRDIIKTGAERLGWELETLMDKTLQAMRASEAQVAEELASLT